MLNFIKKDNKETNKASEKKDEPIISVHDDGDRWRVAMNADSHDILGVLPCLARTYANLCMDCASGKNDMFAATSIIIMFAKAFNEQLLTATEGEEE